MDELTKVEQQLKARIAESDAPRTVLRAPELRALYAGMGSVPPAERAAYGKRINELKQQLTQVAARREDELSWHRLM